MDPSIMKLLEEDEDETMHSGADIEAFTAALNRDIEGGASTSQPSDLDSAALSQGSSHISSQFPQWQTSGRGENVSCQSQQDVTGLHQLEQHRYGSGNQQQQINISQELNCLPLQQTQSLDGHPQQQAEQNSLHLSQTRSLQNSGNKLGHVQEPKDLDSESQYPRLQKTSGQVAVATGQATKAKNQIPFAVLIPFIEPQLDEDKATQLRTLYNKLKKNEIPKDLFIPHLRSLVGDQIIKMAVYKVQAKDARNSQSGHNHFPLNSHVSVQQHPQKQSISEIQSSDSQTLGQLHNKGHSAPADQSQISSSAALVFADSSNPTMGNNAQTSREVERQSNSQGNQVSQMSSSSFSATMQEKERPFPIPGLSKQQQQHLHFSQASFPKYGSTGVNYQPFSGTSINSSTQSLKPQPHDSQMREVPLHRSMGATQLGLTSQAAINSMSLSKLERRNSFSETKVQGGTLSQLSNNSTLQHNSFHWQSSTNKELKNGSLSSMTYVKQEQIDQVNEQPQKPKFATPEGLSSFSPVQVQQKSAIPGSFRDESFEMQSSRMGLSSMLSSNSVSSSITAQLGANSSLSSRIPSATSPIGPGINAKTTPEKPTLGQKKPLEALGSSPPLSGKKQKVSGSFSDQSIEQLNDVAAVSGVNLREEEEQLFSGVKEDSRVSEASRRAVQEEEERLILQRTPLQKKMAEILTKCGVKGISNEVERCLSLCVEERMRGLISNLVRLSKQRVDIEKPRHRNVITSDVGQQIMMMNKKVREEWAKKQADLEKLQKMNGPEGNTGVDGDEEKDDGRGKSIKAGYKDDDEKMRTTAANVAARAAVGGDDMLSKWQLMAEQARQKRGGTDSASDSQPGKDLSRESVATRNARDNQESERRNHAAAIPSSGAVRKFGRNQVVVPQPGVMRRISIKDVIAVLEREPQTSKSTLIYRLYEKSRTDTYSC